MPDRIVIRGIRAFGRHGHYPHERERAQPFDVDVEIGLDLRRAIARDDLEKTIDYSLVVREVHNVVEEKSYALMETLADAIASQVLSLGPRTVKVRVAKASAALGLGAAEISVEVERHAARS